MKRIFLSLICGILLLGVLTGCDNNSGGKDDSKANNITINAAEGLEVKTTKTKKKVTLRFYANLDKMSEKAKKEFDIVDSGQTMSDVKKALEEQGYSCKEA